MSRATVGWQSGSLVWCISGVHAEPAGAPGAVLMCLYLLPLLLAIVQGCRVFLRGGLWLKTVPGRDESIHFPLIKFHGSHHGTPSQATPLYTTQACVSVSFPGVPGIHNWDAVRSPLSGLDQHTLTQWIKTAYSLIGREHGKCWLLASMISQRPWGESPYYPEPQPGLTALCSAHHRVLLCSHTPLFFL